MKARTFIIGDVHGCYQELRTLYQELNPNHCDRFIFVGDLVDKGPQSLETLRYVKSLLSLYPGSVAVCGNHESSAFENHLKGKFGESWTQTATKEDWDFIKSMPLLARLPEFNSLVVHGGLFPRFFEHYPQGLTDIKKNWWKGGGKYMSRARRFLRVRYVNPAGDVIALGDETENDFHWSSRYNGREGFVFYGHDPILGLKKPRISPFACGLDTGCVFGYDLTAAVVKEDPTKTLPDFVSVSAHKQYATPLKGK